MIWAYTIVFRRTFLTLYQVSRKINYGFKRYSEFIIDLLARFRDEIGVNIVEKLYENFQTTSLEEYVDEFEELKHLMLQKNHILSDSLFSDYFINQWIKTQLKSLCEIIQTYMLLKPNKPFIPLNIQKLFCHLFYLPLIVPLN